ncbi:MAG: hypothetical protein QXU61_00600 [Archaeoglobaceae archaeon]
MGIANGFGADKAMMKTILFYFARKMIRRFVIEFIYYIAMILTVYLLSLRYIKPKI